MSRLDDAFDRIEELERDVARLMRQNRRLWEICRDQGLPDPDEDEQEVSEKIARLDADARNIDGRRNRAARPGG